MSGLLSDVVRLMDGQYFFKYDEEMKRFGSRFETMLGNLQSVLLGGRYYPFKPGKDGMEWGGPASSLDGSLLERAFSGSEAFRETMQRLAESYENVKSFLPKYKWSAF